MTEEAPLVVSRSRGAAAIARRHVQRAGADWPERVRDTAVLLTSELVTNAIEHGTGAITLLLDTSTDRIRIEVTDENAVIPHAPISVDIRAEHGRGLLLVLTLADAWGVRPAADGTGKTVWLELHRPNPA